MFSFRIRNNQRRESHQGKRVVLGSNRQHGNRVPQLRNYAMSWKPTILHCAFRPRSRLSGFVRDIQQQRILLGRVVELFMAWKHWTPTVRTPLHLQHSQFDKLRQPIEQPHQTADTPQVVSGKIPEGGRVQRRRKNLFCQAGDAQRRTLRTTTLDPQLAYHGLIAQGRHHL